VTPPGPGVAVRVAAAECLERVEAGGGRLAEAIAARRELTDPRDTGLLREIASGVLRNRTLLARILGVAGGVRERACRPLCFRLLLAGAYQVVFLDRVPDRAAVGATVEAARRVLRRGEIGFVNAVLRRTAGLVARKGCPDAETPADERAVLPLPGGRVCVFTRAVLPGREDTVRFLPVRYSHPRWLVRRWVERFGPADAERACAAGTGTPPLVVRANRARTTPERLLERLRAEGVSCRPWRETKAETSPEAGTPGNCLLVDAAPRFEDLESFRRGYFVVQDPVQAGAVDLLELEAGETVVDLCAAPGGKSCAAAEAVGDRGLVVALDLDAGRLGRVRDNARRLGLDNIRPLCADARAARRVLTRRFAAAILDVPCSNTGVLARRPEARWRLREQDVARLAALQKELLREALRLLAPGGRLVYSTCSVEKEENGDVVQAALAGAGNVRLLRESLALPAPDSGGGYAAVLSKRA
jgi:16S rRNA (cytosine967-C5)-methyltransferase